MINMVIYVLTGILTLINIGFILPLLISAPDTLIVVVGFLLFGLNIWALSYLVSEKLNEIENWKNGKKED